MVSPGKILIALAAIVFVGVVSYLTSMVLLHGLPTRTATEPPRTETPQAPQKTVQKKAVEKAPDPVVPVTKEVNFHAIVERNGAVVLCLVDDAIVLPDRCTGKGRLTIVQPLAEGELVSVSATGVVSMENEAPDNPQCAMSRAKWDTATEQVTPAGRNVRTIPPGAVAQQLNKLYPGEANLLPDDIAAAFALDLDGDGREEIVYTADNVPRLADAHEKTQQTYRYFVQGGIFNGRSPDGPSTFVHEIDNYSGGTDTIARVAAKGVVPVRSAAGAFAVLAKTGGGLDSEQTLVWFNGERLEQLESFEFRCH